MRAGNGKRPRDIWDRDPRITDVFDMLVEVELTPPTEGDDIGIGEPFRVKYRTGEGVKTTRLRIVRVGRLRRRPG